MVPAVMGYLLQVRMDYPLELEAQVESVEVENRGFQTKIVTCTLTLPLCKYRCRFLMRCITVPYCQLFNKASQRKNKKTIYEDPQKKKGGASFNENNAVH